MARDRTLLGVLRLAFLFPAACCVVATLPATMALHWWRVAHLPPSIGSPICVGGQRRWRNGYAAQAKAEGARAWLCRTLAPNGTFGYIHQHEDPRDPGAR